MAHAHLGLRRLASVSLLSLPWASTSGCAPRVEHPVGASISASPNREVFPLERALARFHSKRFLVRLALPDGNGWQIDDHSKRALVATHRRTETRLEFEAFELGALASRQKCREVGLARLGVDLRQHSTIEQAASIGPDAYDAELRSTLETDPKTPHVRAHFFAFAGFLGRCIVMHVVTSGRPETLETLSDRLVTYRAQVWGHLEIDDPFAQARQGR
jgi:hypothetical protein